MLVGSLRPNRRGKLSINIFNPD